MIVNKRHQKCIEGRLSGRRSDIIQEERLKDERGRTVADRHQRAGLSTGSKNEVFNSSANKIQEEKVIFIQNKTVV